MKYQYIHGQSWSTMCDAHIDAGINPETREFKIWSNGLENITKQNCVIFCKTDYLKQLFAIVSNSRFNHVLITNNSDFPITETLYNSAPKNIKFWFAENVDVVKPNLFSIPIALERHWGGGVSWDYIIIERILDRPKTLVNEFYMNINVGNNPAKRQPIVDKFKNFKTVTIEKQRLSFEDYLRQVYAHKYVLAPQGNGIDCHRTWETLYLDSIPIVERNIINTEFRNKHNINMIYFDEIDNNGNINSNFKINNNKEFLNFDYWKNFILRFFKTL